MNEDVGAVELATKVLALGATTSLLASLVYDWGFFSALNLSFLEVPSSLSDHVRSALLWFPKVFVSLGAIFVFEMLTRRIERGMSEDELIKSSPDPQWTRKFREGPLRFLSYVSVFVIVGYILAGVFFLQLLPLALCTLWFAFSAWAQSAPLILARRPLALRLAGHFVPPIAIWLYFAGYAEAARLYDSTTEPAKLTTTSSVVEAVVLLRLLEKGALVRENSTSVAFRPWSEIKHIETPGRYTPTPGILCTWFHVGCVPAQKKATR